MGVGPGFEDLLGNAWSLDSNGPRALVEYV